MLDGFLAFLSVQTRWTLIEAVNRTLLKQPTSDQEGELALISAFDR
jgi:hypothetical protein